MILRPTRCIRIQVQSKIPLSKKKSSEQGLQQIPLLCFFPIPHFASIASVSNQEKNVYTLPSNLFHSPKLPQIVVMTHRSSWSSWMVLKKITIGVPTVRPGRIMKSLLLNSQFQLLANTGNSGIWSFFTDFCNNGLSGSIFCVTRDKQGILQKEKTSVGFFFVWKLWRLLNWNLKAYLNFIKIFGASLWPSAVSICQTIIH